MSKFCKDCVFMSSAGDAYRCGRGGLVERSLVTGYSWTSGVGLCSTERADEPWWHRLPFVWQFARRRCGPEGRHFVKAAARPLPSGGSVVVQHRVTGARVQGFRMTTRMKAVGIIAALCSKRTKPCYAEARLG